MARCLTLPPRLTLHAVSAADATAALDQAESAFNDIQHNYTREFVLESGLFSLLGKVVNANAKSLNEGLLDLSSVDVVKKIAVEWKNYDGEEDDEKPINWKGLGESCEKWSRRAPTVYFLCARRGFPAAFAGRPVRSRASTSTSRSQALPRP